MSSAQHAIGRLVRQARTSQRLTQQQVALMTQSSPWKLSRAAVSAIERGQNFPGLEAMLALSRVLYLDPAEIVERARLSAGAPAELEQETGEELESRAGRSFWAGRFREALAVYDVLLERAELGAVGDPGPGALRVATLEIRRATCLKRAGALLSAVSTVERAISLSGGRPAVQAEAYAVLADLQCVRGHLPLAGDAAARAIELSAVAGPQVRSWAWMVKARVHFQSASYDEARQAYLEARNLAVEAGDTQHLTHIEGNVGTCWKALGRFGEARKWLARAVARARRQGQPTLEASWLVELGALALTERSFHEAHSYARAALQIAKPLGHHLTVFRAEWLRHRILRETRPEQTDRHRLAHLRKLFLSIDSHEGIEEVLEFKRTVMRVV